jgi:hypothetical protein
MLKGSRLGDVVSLSLKGLEFVPAPSTSNMESDALLMAVKPATVAAASSGAQPGNADSGAAGAASAAGTPAPSLQQSDTTKATVTLRDGRNFTVNVVVAAPRPSVELVGKSVQLSARGNESNIQLASEDQLPQDAMLVFSVRAKSRAAFARDENIEVATEDEAFATTLSLANRGLTLADAKVAVATFDPAKSFGFSAFGPLKFRVVSKSAAGDWRPLATLVRLPVLQTLQCPAAPEQACKLTGSNLFLVDSVSGNPEFKEAVQVPDGFPGRALPVPRPGKRGLYLKLRDDPAVVNSATVVAEELPAPPSDATPAASPPAAAIQEPAALSIGESTPRSGGN